MSLSTQGKNALQDKQQTQSTVGDDVIGNSWNHFLAVPSLQSYGGDIDAPTFCPIINLKPRESDPWIRDPFATPTPMTVKTVYKDVNVSTFWPFGCALVVNGLASANA